MTAPFRVKSVRLQALLTVVVVALYCLTLSACAFAWFPPGAPGWVAAAAGAVLTAAGAAVLVACGLRMLRAARKAGLNRSPETVLALIIVVLSVALGLLVFLTPPAVMLLAR